VATTRIEKGLVLVPGTNALAWTSRAQRGHRIIRMGPDLPAGFGLGPVGRCWPVFAPPRKILPGAEAKLN
jgi:hypothetical protein